MLRPKRRIRSFGIGPSEAPRPLFRNRPVRSIAAAPRVHTSQNRPKPRWI